MKLKGLPLNLNTYEASEVLTNKHFQEFKMPEFERIHLPESMTPFTDITPLGTKEFIIDDNRGAVSTLPSLKMDGTDFYLSIKGVGSTTSPFSHQLFGKTEICSLLKDSTLKERIVNSEGNRSTLPYRRIMAKRLPIWGPRAPARNHIIKSVGNGRPYLHSRISSRAPCENSFPS